VRHPDNINFDQRDSGVSLVWRGVWDSKGIEQIQTAFDEAAPYLVHYLDDYDHVEWILSSVIARCAISLEAFRNRRLAKAARVKVMTGVVVGYTIVAAFASCYYIVFK